MSKGLIEMSKDLYKFGGGARQLRCQGFESFLHTLISKGSQNRQPTTDYPREAVKQSHKAFHALDIQKMTESRSITTNIRKRSPNGRVDSIFPWDSIIFALGSTASLCN